MVQAARSTESQTLSRYLRAQEEENRAKYIRAQPDRATPVHTSPRRVYELIRSSIRRGTIPHDSALSEEQLISTLGASRNSVRKALQMLADDGVVVRQRRSGTSIAHDIVSVREGEVGPRAWAGTPDAGRLTVQTLECRRIDAPVGLKHLLGEDVPSVILIEQTGSVGSQPLYLRVGYCLTDLDEASFIEQIERSHNDYPPISVVHERIFGRPFGASTSSVEAISCQERAAALLHVPVGSPVLLRELLTRDSDGVPTELSFTHFRGDRVAILGSTEVALAVPFR